MAVHERASVFACAGDNLVAVLSVPDRACRRGILMLVGGPQVRCGSHRQFTLLARAWAEAGIAVMRFDFRGMGDSGGEPRDFEQTGEDIRAAVGHFLSSCPDLQDVVLWGLCDAASAALLYAAQDPRVGGLVLCNPWVRTAQGQADAYLKHYYLQRLRQAGFWRKLTTGRFRPLAAWRSFRQLLAQRRTAPAAPDALPALPERMADGLRKFSGPVLILLCENDLTAQEFMQLSLHSPAWRRLLGEARVTQYTLAGANHTFSQAGWRRQIADWTAHWLQQSGADHPS